MKNLASVLLLIAIVFSVAFIVTTALSDYADYKSGLYAEGMAASNSWNEGLR